MWVWGIVAGLSLVVIALLLERLALLRAIREIAEEFGDIVGDDTNTLVSLPLSNRALTRLVTELNRALAPLRDERRRLQNGDAELKKAVTNIAHDIRTPLTAISGYLDLLEKEQVSGEAREYLSVIRERSDALRALTDELFHYSLISSTIDELHFEDVDICAELEQSMVGYYGALSARGIAPQIELPEAPVLRRLDRRALRRSFNNIIGNAVKYSDGDLRVKLAPDGKIEFSNSASALDEVSVGKLFDRFYTVETGRSSTGLGLSIAKLLVERMGGRIFARYGGGRLHIEIDFAAEEQPSAIL